MKNLKTFEDFVNESYFESTHLNEAFREPKDGTYKSLITYDPETDRFSATRTDNNSFKISRPKLVKILSVGSNSSPVVIKRFKQLDRQTLGALSKHFEILKSKKFLIGSVVVGLVLLSVVLSFF